eukprot:GHVN01033981.1.p3 GENE.GHVN01033981.1~~GHVN01033981.1.p3  ORF type:complete len:142 (-),score=18.76 GHVN01033981.1:701-1126(-)
MRMIIIASLLVAFPSLGVVHAGSYFDRLSRDVAPLVHGSTTPWSARPTPAVDPTPPRLTTYFPPLRTTPPPTTTTPTPTSPPTTEAPFSTEVFWERGDGTEASYTYYGPEGKAEYHAHMVGDLLEEMPEYEVLDTRSNYHN